jgi:hypothetical protein
MGTTIPPRWLYDWRPIAETVWKKTSLRTRRRICRAARKALAKFGFAGKALARCAFRGFCLELCRGAGEWPGTVVGKGAHK